MFAPDYDVVIAGARCAGASLATFLARAGARVLVVDRDALPSDHVLSTHTIHPPGVDVLDELGVGDAVRLVAPPTRIARLRKGSEFVDVELNPGRVEYCPRRARLDGLLQQAAVDAGAELRDRTRVTRVLIEDGRARGVVLFADGREETVRADLVVGADGRHSTVARQVGAEEYLAYDAPRAMYWAYWETPDRWVSSHFPFDMYIGKVGMDIRVVFQTDDGELLIGSLPPVEAARRWRDDPYGALRRNLAADHITDRLAGAAEPTGPVRGTLQERYYFRQGAGPGWVLVGDAGHHKEFVIGDGITEALLQVRSLAPAIAAGSDAALTHWWRARDVAALPYYFWGRDEGSLQPPDRLDEIVLERAALEPEIRQRMAGLFDHAGSPYDVLPPARVMRWVLAAMVRGQFHVLAQFRERGRRATELAERMLVRQGLLDEAVAAMQPAPRRPSLSRPGAPA